MLTLSLLIPPLPGVLAAPSAEQQKNPNEGGVAARVEPGLTKPTPLTGTGINLPEDSEGTFLAFAANAVIEDTPLSSWNATRAQAATIFCRYSDL